jgi:UDP-galactopyranose mutase
MENAYPIIDIDTKKRIKPMFDYLKKFKNLYNIGRNAEFKYAHTHEIFRNAKSIIQVIDMKSNID